MLDYINSYEVHHWIMMFGWVILVMAIFYLFDNKEENVQSILKNRLATGDITIDEFNKLKKVLQFVFYKHGE